jgi:acyl-CoA thioesterase
MSPHPKDNTEELSVALQLEQAGEHVFSSHVPDGWQQGRGAFGGLVLGLLAEAIQRSEPEAERMLRTLSGEILAPVVPGPVEITVEVIRRGNGLSSFVARLRQDQELRAHASAILAKKRIADRERLSLSPPSLPDWKSVEVVPPSPLMPPFARGFEFRPVGMLPFAGTTESVMTGWVRARKPPARLGPTEVLALIDAYWPVAMIQETAPRPMATVSFTFQLHIDPSRLDPQVPLRHRATQQVSHDGYSAEHRELWTADGELVALNPQIFVIIR